jgi:hypothetical protein
VTFCGGGRLLYPISWIVYPGELKKIQDLKKVELVVQPQRTQTSNKTVLDNPDSIEQLFLNPDDPRWDKFFDVFIYEREPGC